MSTIKNQIIAYWPNIAVGTSIIRYTNSDGAAIAYCVKQSSNYGTLSVMPIGTDRPLKGWVNAAGWKWDEYILTSDYGYVRADVDGGQSWISMDIQGGKNLVVYKNGSKVGSVALTQ
ncbi:hypothetical protein [Enterocloster asparagiformis]|uniref:hypothetical protein n=1 Tax=Enterocloster asparagiformis TaxID=333367 RepID=UPI0011CA93E1|nr:hypothetical protein [Enterocloster asparagiformis]